MAAIYNFPSPKRVTRDFANPPLVKALCPEGTGAMIQLQISPSTVQKLIQARRATEMFQAWEHLVGETPPVHNGDLQRKTDFSEAQTSCLLDAHACFKGVNRRYDNDENGGEVYVYIINTAYTVRCRPSMRGSVAYFRSPDSALLTVQAKPRSALHDCQDDIWGGIVKWEFVNADKERTEFPVGFDARYDMLVWPR